MYNLFAIGSHLSKVHSLDNSNYFILGWNCSARGKRMHRKPAGLCESKLRPKFTCSDAVHAVFASYKMKFQYFSMEIFISITLFPDHPRGPGQSSLDEENFSRAKEPKKTSRVKPHILKLPFQWLDKSFTLRSTETKDFLTGILCFVSISC